MSDKHYIERYWRDATPQDAIKEPPMVARFRDKSSADWAVSYLRGIDTRRGFWFSDGNVQGCTFWWQCQVYDAPDPGEGWRLIDHTEKPMPGDEHFVNNWGWCWCNEHISGIPYTDDLLLRRRIEQPKPELKYVPFTWEDREQLRGRLITFVDRNRTVEFRCESFAVDDDGLLVNDTYAPWLCKNAVFVDTGEPVGKKVTQ